MRRTFLFLLIFALSLGAAQAQRGNQPLYAYRNGDLWQFDLAAGSATQLTEWAYNGGPILSPDGRSLVYLSTSAAFVAQFEAGVSSQTGAGTAPANIWLLDIASGRFRRIADQSGASAGGYLRSLPVWSPDSRRLAWLQVDANAPHTTATLQIYQLDSGWATTLVSNVDLGVQARDIRMPSLRWGEGGIARLHFSYLGGSQNAYLFLEIYNAATGILTRYNLELNAERDNSPRDFFWVRHQGRSLLALQIQDYWQVLDPRDGRRQRLAEPPRLQNRFLTGGLQLIPRSVAAGSDGWQIHWFAALAGNLYDTGYKSARVNRNYRPALSPDGRQIAWHNGDRISTWQPGIGESNRPPVSATGVAFPIPEPSSVVWAPTEWVTTGAVLAPAAAPAATGACSLPPLLRAGQQAVVSPGLANRLRAAPSISAEQVGRIEAGERVQIEAGPVCADGYHWYQVRNFRVAGWTAEGAGGEYWLLAAA